MKLSILSLNTIAERVIEAVQRFPLVFLTSVVATFLAMWLVGLSNNEQQDYQHILKMVFVAGIGISYFFGIATFLEQKTWGVSTKIGLNVLAVVLLVIYYFFLGDSFPESAYEINYQFALFVLASHLGVSFSPFLSSGKLDQFWEYNKNLFLRILMSVLYSGALFVGLSIALLAIDNLLELEIRGEAYAQLFFFIGGIFNTWFFLAGVPNKESIFNENIKFPTGLKVFVQYVLIPLVTVYIFILYLYFAKILLEWELPNGWVSNLVLSFSIAGILSLLLLYPIRNNAEFKWVGFYSKGYYIALIPLIGLLMVSIWVRISEYGVTINRYFVVTLGVWLTGIVLYHIISKTKSIKVIPISLCLITLLVSFGPLGASAVSERSQLGRLEEVLARNNMLDGFNIINKKSDAISFEDRKMVSGVVTYIVENHGAKMFGRYFEESIEDILNETTLNTENDRNIVKSDAQKIVEAMGIDFVTNWTTSDSTSASIDYYEFAYNGNELLPISGYDYAISDIQFWSGSKEKVLGEDGNEWRIIKDEQFQKFSVKKLTTNSEVDIPYSIIKDNLIQKYGARYSDVYFSELLVNGSNEDFEVLCLFTFLSGNQLPTESLSSVRMTLFIKLKK